jgi:hypothetical protein
MQAQARSSPVTGSSTPAIWALLGDLLLAPAVVYAIAWEATWHMRPWTVVFQLGPAAVALWLSLWALSRTRRSGRGAGLAILATVWAVALTAGAVLLTVMFYTNLISG